MLCYKINPVLYFSCIFLFLYITFWQIASPLKIERHDKNFQQHFNDLLFGLIIFSFIFFMGKYQDSTSFDYLLLSSGSLITFFIWSFISKSKHFQFDLSNMTQTQNLIISCITFICILIAVPILIIIFNNFKNCIEVELLSIISILLILFYNMFVLKSIKLHHYQIFALLAIISNQKISNNLMNYYIKFISGLCIGSVAHGITAYNATGILVDKSSNQLIT